MKLKDIKNNFLVIGENGIYHIYDPKQNSSKYMNHKYLCTIHYNSKNNQVSILNGQHDEMPDMKYICYFDKNVKIDAFIRTVNDYISTLKYPSEFYDPTYREHYRIHMKINYYLKTLGFENAKNDYNVNNNSTYRYTLSGIHPHSNKTFIDISISYDEDKSSGKILEFLNSYKWIEYDFINLNDCIEKINSIIGPELLHAASFALNTHDELSDNVINLDNVSLNYFNPAQFETYSLEMKEKVIKKLEDALNKLKNN